MADLFQIAGAQSAPSDFAPLHINRMVTGYWTNTNPLRDAATSMFIEKFYGGRQDRIAAGVNVELSTRLTLRRRPGTSVYNQNTFPGGITRFYGWNTFTLTQEAVRVMADTSAYVYDVTGLNGKTMIWSKAVGSGPTFFLGVGNILYFTNGLENKQLSNVTGQVTDWGVTAPTTAPTLSQNARPNPYPAWQGNSVFCTTAVIGSLVIIDPNGFLQRVIIDGTTGPTPPTNWNQIPYQSTQDGSVTWQNMGPYPWAPNHQYAYGDVCVGQTPDQTGIEAELFWCTQGGVSGTDVPGWVTGMGVYVADGPNGVTWRNGGKALQYSDIGSNTPIIGTAPQSGQTAAAIVDGNGNLQLVAQPGKTGPLPPNPWQTQQGAYTTDGTMVWLNGGPFAVAATAAAQYGYAYQNSTNTDLSNMSPPSVPITVSQGGQVIVQGVGSGQAGIDTIPIYRTPQGGSIFLLLATIPNPGAGNIWTYTDNTPDSGLNPTIQALVNGEGTPLPIGATCLEYNYGRIWAAVGNVVYASSGPDAIVAGSSGNAGFDMTFTFQSLVKRLWATPAGLIVFTVRDVYIITGNGAPAANGGAPFVPGRYIDNLPLLNYDAFAIFLTTPYLLSGHGMVNALDPSSGIVEASFPIADQIAAMNPKTAYVTFHSGGSGETALYVADGTSSWYRMAPTSAPESGLNWNPQATIVGGTSAVQSVEILPGQFALLIGPPASGGPILMRDPTVNTDNGTPFAAWAHVGNIVLAQSGKLAGLAWVGVESEAEGSATELAVMLDEIAEIPKSQSANFYPVPRSRQDPPNMPPSESLFSNRHSLLQGQKPVWCKSLQLMFYWPNEDAANELLTFTIFGETWAEQRSQ
jgi:hypothetical protein